MWREWGQTCSISLTSNSSEDAPRMPVKILCTSVSLLMMLHYWPPQCSSRTAIQTYYSELQEFMLTVNISKMKFLVVIYEVQDSGNVAN